MKANYTEKALNNPTDPYRRGGIDGTFKLSNKRQNTITPTKDEQDDSKSVLDSYVADLGTESPDIKSFRKLVENRLSIKNQTKGSLKRWLCCRSHHLDRMIDGAKKHIRQELDIVRFIKKQRLHANLLWGISSPFQRALCRSQSHLLVYDKLEAEFSAIKLNLVRRIDETLAW